MTNWGGSPTLIEQVKGTITLRGIVGARAVSVQPIDGAGQPVGAPIMATRAAPSDNAAHAGDSWKIPIGDTVTTWYEITVQR